MENIQNDWLEPVMTRDWLNLAVEARQMAIQVSTSCGGVIMPGVDEAIHVRDHIRELAAAAGAELEEEYREGCRYPFYYSFRYRGMRFFQVSVDRLWEQEGMDV